MKLVKLLLIHWILLAWETRALDEIPPIEVPCTATVDNEPTCNENKPETIDFSDVIVKRNITSNSTALDIRDLNEDNIYVKSAATQDGVHEDKESQDEDSLNDTQHEILIEKCCNKDQYFDNYTCHERLLNMSDYNSLVQEFLHSDTRITSTSIRVGKCKCRYLKQVDVAETYLDTSGQLCENTSGICYPHLSYCIEHLRTGDELEAVAFICPTNVFYKCCQDNEVLTESGCRERGHNYTLSFKMSELMEILEHQNGFPTEGDEMCNRRLVTSTDRDIRWWVNMDGYLSLSTDHSNITTEHYCVDDYQDGNIIHTVIIMCRTDMERNLTSLGKCCPHGEYLQDLQCVTDNQGLNLLKDSQFRAANVTDIPFTSFPICHFKMGYHMYPFGQQTEDYAEFGIDKTMRIVSMENGCLINQNKIRNNTFCIDYIVNETGNHPYVFVCAGIWDSGKKFQEKYTVTAVLLGISCTALAATAFWLITTRVKRGLVTVKKIKTLGGRILLSYVLTFLMAFLLLAIGNKVTFEEGRRVCFIFAGSLIFFLLASFQWNTSICMEFLFLTVGVSVSENCRYLCHSLWAWGIPGIITTIALTLDYNRESLPCSVITPRIGLYRCFFSDKNAQLLYLYLPIFMSLCANMILILVSRHLRNAKLRRLEQNVRKISSAVNAIEIRDEQIESSDQNTSQTLSSYQTRDLWVETMQLVVWSGVTWMAEVVSFLVSSFVELSDSWYNYLWYIPSSINSLRGVGIFVILVLTPENRLKISKVVGNLSSWARFNIQTRKSRLGYEKFSSNNHEFSL